MKPSVFLVLFTVAGFFHAGIVPASRAATNAGSFSVLENFDQSAPSSQPESNLTIPGPLRSFLRMSGLSQSVSPPEVLPILAHTVILRGYQLGKPTEFLILLRRYVRQSKELSALVGQDGNIRINGCKDAEPLLRILGYKTQGQCGQSAMALITADPERAFLTVDSAFPLLDLEAALQRRNLTALIWIQHRRLTAPTTRAIAFCAIARPEEFFSALRNLGVSATQAPAMVARQMVGQAYLLAADDLFWISGWIALSMIAIVWIARRPKAPSGPVAAD